MQHLYVITSKWNGEILWIETDRKRAEDDARRGGFDMKVFSKRRHEWGYFKKED